ncbi:uncharacterized protein LOC144541726 [Centroberyx gerrardi]
MFEPQKQVLTTKEVELDNSTQPAVVDGAVNSTPLDGDLSEEPGLEEDTTSSPEMDSAVGSAALVPLILPTEAPVVPVSLPTEAPLVPLNIPTEAPVVPLNIPTEAPAITPVQEGLTSSLVGTEEKEEVKQSSDTTSEIKKAKKKKNRV